MTTTARALVLVAAVAPASAAAVVVATGGGPRAVGVDLRCGVDGRRLVVGYDARSTGGHLVEARYDHGDGTSSVRDLTRPPTVEQLEGHRYAAPGSYEVRLTVRGPAGTATDRCRVEVR